MIDIQYNKEFTFRFSEDQLKNLLIESLRIDGEQIPEAYECTLVLDSDRDEISFSFTQEDLDTYLKDLADREKESDETDDAWSSDTEKETD